MTIAGLVAVPPNSSFPDPTTRVKVAPNPTFAWTFDGIKAGFGTKNFGTTVSGNPSATIGTGKVLVAYCGSKAATHTSVTDSVGNTWTLLEDSQSSGVEVSIWKTKTVYQINTSDTITLTVGTSVGAKALQVFQWTPDSGQDFTYVGSSASSGNGLSGSTTLSGMPNSEHVWLGIVAVNYGTSVDGTAGDYSSTFGTGGNPLSSNFTASHGYDTYTGTSYTWQGNFGTSSDWAAVLVAVDKS